MKPNGGGGGGERPAVRFRYQVFRDLMRFRITDILFAATPYDSFLLEEAGELSEQLAGEFRTLDLQHAPSLTNAATGEEALALLGRQHAYNLLVTTPQLADMDAVELARRARAERPDVPVVLLARDSRELAEFRESRGLEGIERAFLWQGDARILVAIVKAVEDRRNVEDDSALIGVQVILLVEDSVRQYSSFLPKMYTELFRHSERVLSEGLNLSQKLLRLRARPKILLCSTWEEASSVFERYGAEVLGVVSDVEFPRGGVKSPTAGADFAREVRARYPDIPIILHSSQPENEELARRVGASFLLKGSSTLLEDLGRVMLEDFGFGDFVFRTPDGEEIARASDLRELEERLREIPEESLLFHASRNHFSRWLKARTVFAVAHALRPRRPDEYPSVEAIRRHLTRSIADYREAQSLVAVVDFDRDQFDFGAGFYRIGGGSIGGKARGLAFVRRLIAERGLRRRFRGLEVTVPKAVVLGTEVFERFLERNDLLRFALQCEDDDEIRSRFREATFPEETVLDLARFVEVARFPIAVRSSSLLEDSQHQPFTGVYDTLMLWNHDEPSQQRLKQLLDAVRSVYASTFLSAAKAYVQATSYRLEEERMAVILQALVGSIQGGDRFYPTFSGVARSHNFYPSGPMRREDGIAAVALGLGRTIVDGEACLRFCPKYPRQVQQLASAGEALRTTQRSFWALERPSSGSAATLRETRFRLEVAERDGTLATVASTYSVENDALSDGVARPGTRVISFAPVLKYEEVPLAEALSVLQVEGARGMGHPVEIEFAVDLAGGGRGRFGLLQMRPLAVSLEGEVLEVGEIADDRLIVRSRRVLGNGRVDGLLDLVMVDLHRFQRSRSREVATELGRLNARLVEAHRPYALIGVGRWGSRDPWLGIPVGWDQVSGARVIVECSPKDIAVEPSQGSHFFQNLTAFHVGYFTIEEGGEDGFVDWGWLADCPAAHEAGAVRHLRFEAPLVVRMDGRRGEGVIFRPCEGGNEA